ncbi:cohesin subunit SMC1 [Pneumocystis jirovecii RU7]|uniref:Structural maintenance of chromosomes protein n=1 Tax=Pneumocystis jirovecii (strain RU7) TaxID=1408657 RepID=A0A0W4ZRQ4_PNEJ7|nr:cohesin subunit SMC1 [Pneumocystis jirovecii RU7]KTW31066.1 hypothetical protein T551_01618 [Pneumocystis jirovecii RU7]
MGRLVRLELQNFKSYKGHQIIGPFYDFTSIIGPNGSGKNLSIYFFHLITYTGKSNLMDAISFVLGLKSSQLRSSHFMDLIYRETILNENSLQRKPDIGVNDAWVMLVYENDNGNYIQYKKTISPSGVTECLIDNKVVTVAAYNKALEAHNILVKAKNFLVFQGDVEAIASQSPKDLTRLIEQISGSLEYKSEYEKLKIEQERAIDNSTYAFHRKRGINAEIKQYKEQKAEAENYSAKLDERDDAIALHLLWKLFHLECKINSNKEVIFHNISKSAELNREKKKFQENLYETKKIQAKVMKDILKQEKSIREKEKALEEQQPALITAEEKINGANMSIKKYSSRINEIERDQSRQSNYILSFEKDLSIVKKALQNFEEKQAKLAKQKGVIFNDFDLEKYKKLKTKVNNEASIQKQELENLLRQYKIDSESTNILQEKFNQLKKQKDILEDEVYLLSMQKSEMNEKVNQLMQDLKREESNLEVAHSSRIRIAQKEVELNEKLQECLNKLLQINADKRESERELKTKDIVNTLKRIFPGVRGRIIDLYQPTQRKYEIAVATICGKNINSIVVNNQKIAKECIEYLHDQRLGVLTFIPLDTCQVKSIDQKLRNIHPQARLAIDVISYESSVERAIQFAIGNALICDDFNIAKNIRYNRDIEAKIVTLDGTALHKAGLITGGQNRNFKQEQKWDENEIEALKQLRDNLMNRLQDIQKDKKRNMTEEIASSNISGLKPQLEFSKENLNIIQRNLNGKKEEIEHIKRQLKEMPSKLEKDQNLLNENTKKISELQNKINDIEDKIFQDFCSKIKVKNIREYENSHGSWVQETTEKRMSFLTQESKLNNQLTFEKQRLDETSERIKKLQMFINRDSLLILELEKKKKETQETINILKTELLQKRETHTIKKKEHDKKAQVVNELCQEINKLTKQTDLLFKMNSEAESEIERISSERYAIFKRCKLEEINIPLISGNLNDIPIDESIMQNHINTKSEEVNESNIIVSDWKIEIDYSSLDKSLKENGSIDIENRLFEKISELTSEIEKIAPNMKAIERLEGVESKLHDTEKDFDKARKEAKQARDNFNAIKRKRYSLFYKAYTHISEQIDQIYKDLTKSKSFPLGGTAYLSLEDTEEPYLNGVKYHAMPPMKRFRDMEQLSGGEKTIAALALLFAIHSYKPSPFFVLDEVDAALDNANVTKIANYIRQHAGNGFQFIVISLKNGLFHQSEALLGIYREHASNSSRSLTLNVLFHSFIF